MLNILNMTTALVRRSMDQIACDMNGEIVVLDLKSGTYYGMDAVGAKVWSVIEQPASLTSIVDAVMAEYEVDAETCERDVLAFINRMKAAGLVEVGDESTL